MIKQLLDGKKIRDVLIESDTNYVLRVKDLWKDKINVFKFSGEMIDGKPKITQIISVNDNPIPGSGGYPEQYSDIKGAPFAQREIMLMYHMIENNIKELTSPKED